jgi:uncharacterized membrane protein YphA (DoxX/SURF4 family)
MNPPKNDAAVRPNPLSGESSALGSVRAGPFTDRLFTLSSRLFLLEDTPARINGILRLLVGGAFVIAGVLKISDPAKFALDVSHYRLLPHELINLVAILVPWLEVTIGSFVLAGIWLRAAALLITCLTAMFFAIIMSALVRGLNIECGCFGTIGGKHIGLVNLAIDSTLFLLAALLAKRSKAGPENSIFSGAGSACKKSLME